MNDYNFPIEDSNELASVIEDNMGLVISISKQFKLYDPNDREDLIQHGRIGLWKAAKNHDPNRGTKFVTTAYTYIRIEMLRFLQGKKDHYQLDETLPIEGKPQKNTWEYIPTTLSTLEQKVLDLRLCGHTFVSINKQMGRKRGWSNNVFKKVIKKIQNANKA